MDKKRGIAIELAVFAMVVATAIGGLIVTNLLFSATKTSKLISQAKERAMIDCAADRYLISSGSETEYNGYVIEGTDSDFVVKKDGEVKLTVIKVGDKIVKWKY